MALPNTESAQVDPEKLTEYLLSESHPVGRSKARFFRGVGFNESNVERLQWCLMEIARSQPVVESLSSCHGRKYVVDGAVTTPVGSQVTLRTIWIIEEGQIRPRFVTAYPA